LNKDADGDEEMKESDSKHKNVKFDNLYDMLFDSNHQMKSLSLNTKLKIEGERLDFLDSEGKNVLLNEKTENDWKQSSEQFQNIKISKQFKLVNPLPKFQSVPATPQFFDLAGAYVKYPDLAESLGKYKQGQGLFKKLTGFFGRS
jgi:hypothetical protein